jgi:hypothetical protein
MKSTKRSLKAAKRNLRNWWIEKLRCTKPRRGLLLNLEFALDTHLLSPPPDSAFLL